MIEPANDDIDVHTCKRSAADGAAAGFGEPFEQAHKRSTLTAAAVARVILESSVGSTSRQAVRQARAHFCSVHIAVHSVKQVFELRVCEVGHVLNALHFQEMGDR